MPNPNDITWMRKQNHSSPVEGYRTIIQDSGDPGYVNRLLIGTATTGLVRVEWVSSRYGQIIPVNWSMVTVNQFINSYMPLRYQVADAQNLIVREFIQRDFEWLFLLEHDVIMPPDGFLRLNEYIMEEKYPVVSGLYFTRSKPAEPLIFRGRGTGYYGDFELGDMVWCDGVPTGCLLIHRGPLEQMWNDAEEYQLANQTTRRVFVTPRAQWSTPDDPNEFHMTTGTSDLDWCTRVIEGDYLRKGGWGEFVDNLEDARYPFLVDTRFLCRHIDMDGTIYP